jgi:hypothetical protein
MSFINFMDSFQLDRNSIFVEKYNVQDKLRFFHFQK